jgi:hypothetical protein
MSDVVLIILPTRTARKSERSPHGRGGQPVSGISFSAGSCGRPTAKRLQPLPAPPIPPAVSRPWSKCRSKAGRNDS